MSTISRRMAVGAMAVVAAGVAPYAARGQDMTMKGVILEHTGDRLVLRTDTGEHIVRIQDATKVESVVGVLGARRESRAASELIPGLAVEVSGSQVGQEVVAGAITFKPGDLKTAKQIQGGLHGTQQRLSEAEERIENIDEYVPKERAKVFFAVGSSTLSAKGKQDLQAIAAKAKTYKGYRLAVVGRADPTGNTAANQRLSEARAAAVTAYLLQSCGVLPGRLLPSAAVGESPVFADPDPPANNTEARRVTVTIAVSKANQPSPH